MPGLKKLVITRPKEDADLLAETLTARGFNCINEPMLTIERLKVSADALYDYATVIVSSKHAVTALAALTNARDMSMYASGAATAETARTCGFTNVIKAGNTGLELLHYMRAKVAQDFPKCVYACGTETTHDIAGELSKDGFSIVALPLYRAMPAEQFSPEFKTSVEHAEVDGVLFFSQRTAMTYVSLALTAQLAKHHARIAAFSLSTEIADRLRSLPWQDITVAQTPDMAGILNCLENFSCLN